MSSLSSAPVDTKLEKFSAIGIRLSAEKDVHKLLELILTECMAITGCDAGSLYIKEQGVPVPELIFSYTENASMSFPFKAFKLPIDMNSIAGACATTGNIYNFANMSETFSHLGFHHNKHFDASYGYETCNMLTLPLKNYNAEMIGVMQLINKKKDPNYRFIAYEGHFEDEVIAFDEEDVKIVSALASQAAILIERGLLFKDIENLLDSMIDTLVTALDQRDPITAGHSKRVSSYALALAHAVNADDQGYFKSVSFSEEALRELRIAGMLHDVGKIGVREYVLMKQNKLSDDCLLQIKWRFKYLQHLFPNEKLALSQGYALIERTNRSGFLSDEDATALSLLKGQSFTDLDGESIACLTDAEYDFLSVKRGNLTASERKEINDHVAHTFRILSGIEWTKNLKAVPRIASDHHEKLNGEGYPEGRSANDLELRSRILAIADIFDALTAKDRPYKPAIPVDKSLAILEDEVAKGSLDPHLVALFKNKAVYKELLP